jgi:hypothetical protein
MDTINDDNKLWLSEAMKEFNKKFEKNKLNILNGHAGSGKSKFIFDDFLTNTKSYVEGFNKNLCNNLDRVLYVCDTNMLKSSILKETEEKCITKLLETGDLKQAMKNKGLKAQVEGDIGYIKVITYSTFSFLLKNEASRTILLKYYDCIIMDEMQNLFKYANRFDSEKNKIDTYGSIIELLPKISKSVLAIGISATPHRIYKIIRLREIKITTKTTFNELELKRIKNHTNKYPYTFAYMINQIKWLCNIVDYVKNKYKLKILIYTNTVDSCEKYKSMLTEYGYNVEWLCSVNNKITNEETGKKEIRMSGEQLEIRENLINTGLLPDDLDVLIVNGAYETGWNLRDERVQMVIIDDLDYDTQIQARNRIRHNIEYFRYKVPVDSDGIILEYDQYNNVYRTEYGVGHPLLAMDIEEKYIGVKLSKEDKGYLVSKYALRWFDQKDINWQTFKKYDLEKSGFIVKTTGKGTAIYRKEDVDVNKDTGKIEVKKMNKEDTVIEWLRNIWDRERIPCNEVRDTLDFGRKTWENIIKSENFNAFLKENRITMKPIKGMGKTVYFKVY